MYKQTELKEIIEKALESLIYDPEAVNLTEPVKYVLSIGGKRIRPVLTLMTCNLFKDMIDEAVFPAAGIEVFHNFTLVHDDIMDNAPLRRGLPTVHSRWGISQAVLSGDVMAFIANDCVMKSPVNIMPEVFRIYNKAAIEVCVGQQLDMDFETRAQVFRNEYLRMIELKTAVLMAAAARIGAVTGGADGSDSNLMYEFGRNLGLAFQLQDDLLDAYGESEVFGKIQGGDIKANKKTYLYVLACEKASSARLSKLKDLYRQDHNRESKVNDVLEMYDALKVKEQTENDIREYFDKAFFSLGKTSVIAARKKGLEELAFSLINREK